MAQWIEACGADDIDEEDVVRFFEATNIIYNEVEKRSFVKLNAITLVFTLKPPS